MESTFTESIGVYLIIFLAAAAAYFLSTLSGGGGSLLLVPVINLLIGAKASAPVINLGNLIGEPVRLIIFWKIIDWKVSRYYVLPAIAGTVLSALIFSTIELKWLQVIVGLFLVSTIFQYRLEGKGGHSE
jgi:uncharacterized membrane protein YfcA